MNIFSNDSFTLIEDKEIKIVFNKNNFDKGFKSFLKQYPDLITSTIQLGADAIQGYKTAKNSTARFYAKTPHEKKIYKDITDILINSGKFKLVTKKFKDSGIFYELVHQ